MICEPNQIQTLSIDTSVKTLSHTSNCNTSSLHHIHVHFFSLFCVLYPWITIGFPRLGIPQLRRFVREDDDERRASNQGCNKQLSRHHDIHIDTLTFFFFFFGSASFQHIILLKYELHLTPTHMALRPGQCLLTFDSTKRRNIKKEKEEEGEKEKKKIKRVPTT